MTEPRLVRALITSDGLTATWTGVPDAGGPEALRLAVIVLRDDGSEVRFVTTLPPAAEEPPVVSVWDSASVQEREHEAPETAITRDGGDVAVVFPRSWVDALVDSGDLHGIAVATIDGVDGAEEQLDLEIAG